MPKNKEEKINIPKTPVAYMWFMVKDHKWAVFFSVLVATLAELVTTSTSYIFRRIIDAAEGVGNGTSTQSDVMMWALLFPTAIFMMDLLWRASGFSGMRWMTRANAQSYAILFDYLGKQSHSYFSDRFAGSLSSKVTHASDGVQSFYESFLWSYYPGILALLFTGAYITSVSLIAGGMFLLMLFILVPVNLKLAKYRRPHVVAYSEQTTKTRGYLVDTLTNMGAVRQYSAHGFEKERFGKELASVRSLNLKQWTISEWGLVINNTIIAIFQFAIVGVTITLWRNGILSTGELVMMVTLLLNVTGTLVFIGSSINGFIRRYAEIEEGLTDVLRDYEIADIDGAKTLSVKEGLVTFDDVNFEFGENNVFADFNLVIKPGERVGLVGHSGAGKTTFVSLLLRQHDVTSGAIMIDDQDIAQVTQDSLRDAIAVVPQEPMLFHRTIRENIAYGNPNATNEEIIEVAKKAQAHDFISTLEHGYDTMVGERGIKLSGGQKQRVAIARAMLKNAPLLILDEATSALDSESEVAIQEALQKLMEGKTVVAIAHRLSTLREMDRIIVLEKGKIIEDGSHDSLKDSGGVYQRLWEHQAGGFLTE
jgi:ABC-type multidrug transport system fused ATPase/permease subunit